MGAFRCGRLPLRPRCQPGKADGSWRRAAGPSRRRDLDVPQLGDSVGASTGDVTAMRLASPTASRALLASLFLPLLSPSPPPALGELAHPFRRGNIR